MADRRRFVRRLLVALGCAVALLAIGPAMASAHFGVESFSAELSSDQAGAHADFTTSMSLEREAFGNPDGQLKSASFTLPAGLLGNPRSLEQCPLESFERLNCGRGSQVGEANLTAVQCRGLSASLTQPVEAGARTLNVANAKAFCADEADDVVTVGSGSEAEQARVFAIPDATTLELEAPLEHAHGVGEAVVHHARTDSERFPIFDLPPSPGHVATLGVSLLLANAFIQIDVAPDGQLIATIEGLSTILPLTATSLTLWGVPADSSHDSLRCGELRFECGPSPAAAAPFMSNPTSCEGAGQERLNVTSWQGGSDSALATLPAMEGCESLAIDPQVAIAASTARRDSPAGYDLDLSVPQEQAPYASATPALKQIAVTLPGGVSLSPGLANGLQVCEPVPAESGECPAAAKVGTAEASSPLLAEPLRGGLYIGAPAPGEPFRLYMRLSLGASTIGVWGRVQADESSGTVTAIFERLPELPLEALHLHFFGGPGAALANPLDCGTASGSAALTSYAGQSVQLTPTVAIDEDSGGGPCPATLPFAPSFSAGSVSPQAGHSSPFVLNVSRADGQQYLSSFTAHLPAGLVGLLRGVARCTPQQAATGTCDPAARVGTATVGVGPGPLQLQLSGPVYLTGPYDGAPLGLVLSIDAAAGPFELGHVVVRSRLFVDPNTLAITIVSDDFPQTVGGIPLRMRALHVALDRSGLLVNPTSCRQQSITAVIRSSEGSSVATSMPFASSGCAGLPFKPRVAASSTAKAGLEGNGAQLQIALSGSPGEAATRALTMQMPAQLRPRLLAIQHACALTGPIAAAGACPPGSIVGRATVSSPVTSSPLSGPVYLVARGGTALPSLVLLLSGEGLAVDLEGTLAISHKDAISATFGDLPDAPISTFQLDLPRGPHSLLGAVAGLCRTKPAIAYRLTAQSGAVASAVTRVAVSGCRPAAKRAGARRASRGAARGRR